MARTKFSELRSQVVQRPGAKDCLSRKREETLREISLYEVRHQEAISQIELGGRLEITQGAISKMEHADDVRVSTLRQYLEAMGARLADWSLSPYSKRTTHVGWQSILATARKKRQADARPSG